MGFSKEVLQKVLPKKHSSAITDDVVEFLNNAETNPNTIDEFRENFMTYSKVLSEGKYSLAEYVNAVKFVTNKMLGYTDIDSYALVFPERYERIMEDNNNNRDIVSVYASRYKKTKLVTQIFEQTILPSYIYNAPYFQEAILEAVKIMQTSKSDIARVNACSIVLTHTKPPEDQKLQLEIGVKENNEVADLMSSMKDLANTQLEMLKQGATIKQISSTEVVSPEEKD